MSWDLIYEKKFFLKASTKDQIILKISKELSDPLYRQQRKDMKGKNVFKKDEINKIAELIRLRCMANREEQKQIRAKMRRLGYFASMILALLIWQKKSFTSS